MTPYDCLRAFYGVKIVGSPCRKDVKAQPSATGSVALYGSIKTIPYRSHTGHRPMSHVWALKGPACVLMSPYGSAFKTTFIDPYNAIESVAEG